MIRIDRSVSPPPATFTQPAAAEMARLRKIYRNKATLPKDTLKANAQAIWQASAVRTALLGMQHGKCVYCEWPIPQDYNDVEHFRPKSRYWWLALTWENLFYACPQCNRSAKNDAFDLEPGATRLRPHQPPTVSERHMLVHPTDEQPEAFIGFKFIPGPDEWRPVGLDAGGRGAHTVELLDLDRPFLQERRQQLLEQLQEIADDWQEASAAADVARQATVKGRADVRRGPTAVFARLAQCYLAGVP